MALDRPLLCHSVRAVSRGHGGRDRGDFRCRDFRAARPDRRSDRADVCLGLGLLASGIAAFGAFVPTLIAVCLAEAFAIRSVLIYALGGVAVMLIGYYGAGLASSYAESIDARRR